MIKGNERRVVLVKGEKGSPYEMACIFMRERAAHNSSDIIRDAENIIKQALGEPTDTESITHEKEDKRHAAIFVAGVIAGAVIAFLIYAIIVFGFGYGL